MSGTIEARRYRFGLLKADTEAIAGNSSMDCCTMYEDCDHSNPIGPSTCNRSSAWKQASALTEIMMSEQQSSAIAFSGSLGQPSMSSDLIMESPAWRAFDEQMRLSACRSDCPHFIECIVES